MLCAILLLSQLGVLKFTREEKHEKDQENGAARNRNPLESDPRLPDAGGEGDAAAMETRSALDTVAELGEGADAEEGEGTHGQQDRQGVGDAGAERREGEEESAERMDLGSLVADAVVVRLGCAAETRAEEGGMERCVPDRPQGAEVAQHDAAVFKADVLPFDVSVQKPERQQHRAGADDLADDSDGFRLREAHRQVVAVGHDEIGLAVPAPGAEEKRYASGGQLGDEPCVFDFAAKALGLGTSGARAELEGGDALWVADVRNLEDRAGVATSARGDNDPFANGRGGLHEGKGACRERRT